MASWQKQKTTHGKIYVMTKFLKLLKCSKHNEVWLHTKLMGVHFISHPKLKYLYHQTECYHNHFGTQFHPSSWNFYD